MSTDLRAAITGHLAERRARGYRLEEREQLLGAFLDSLEASGQNRITVPAALAFAAAPAKAARARHAQRLAAVRSFARYVHALDPDAADLVPAGSSPQGSPAGFLTCIPVRRPPGSWPRPGRCRHRSSPRACGLSSG